MLTPLIGLRPQPSAPAGNLAAWNGDGNAVDTGLPMQYAPAAVISAGWIAVDGSRFFAVRYRRLIPSGTAGGAFVEKITDAYDVSANGVMSLAFTNF